MRGNNHLGIKKGMIGKTTKIDLKNQKIWMEIGENTFEFEPNRLSEISEIGNSEMLKLTVGDRIMVTGNSLEDQGIARGTRGRILEASRDQLKVLFDNERKALTIPISEKPLEFDQGYVLSSYFPELIAKAKRILLDLSYLDPILNEINFFHDLVRRNVTIITFTDDWERLMQAVASKIKEPLSKNLNHIQEKSRENGKLELDADFLMDISW